MPSAEPPSREEFLAAPLSEIARVAPATLVYAPGGTRRSAALAGLDPHSEEYVRWSRRRMVEQIGQFFDFGVQHVIMTVLRPAQLAEVGVYRERLFEWARLILAGDEALADYQARGWRVRLIGVEDLPELQPVAAILRELNVKESVRTLWYYASATTDSMWDSLLAVVARHGARTRAEAIQAYYGEAIPPAALFLGFGKPFLADDLLPPLLTGELHCYWTQRPGFDCDAATLRRIWYDYAYLRRTWQADKAGRYQEVEAQRSLWERDPALVVGTGQRLAGGFWYPSLE